MLLLNLTNNEHFNFCQNADLDRDVDTEFKVGSLFLVPNSSVGHFWKPHVILAFLGIYYTSSTLFPVPGPSEISKTSTSVLQALNDWKSPSRGRKQFSLSTRQT